MGKDVEGRDHGLIVDILHNMPKGTEENHNNPQPG
jgi:hypothetical protein